MVKILPITIFIITFLGFIDTFMLLPIIEWYAEELGANLATAGLIIGIYSIINTPVNIAFGRAVDKFGRKMPLTIGLAWEALNMFSYSLCKIPRHLLIVRALHGASGGIIGPSTMSLMANISPKNRKGRMMGLYGSSIGLAVLLGFAGSGVIVRFLGIFPVFYTGSIMLTAGFLLALFITFTRKVDRSNTVNVRSSFIVDFFKLIRKKELAASYFGVFAYFFSFGSLIILMPPYLRKFGMGTFEFALLLTIFSIIFVILQFPCGIITDRIGRKLPIILGLLLATVTFSLIPIFGSFIALTLMMVLYSVGFSFLFPSASAFITEQVAPEHRGVGTGIFHSMLTVGAATGSPVMGYIGELLGVEAAFRVTVTVIILGLLIAAILIKETK